MNSQLAAIVDDLEAAHRRLGALAGRLSPAEWVRRRDPARWSPLECIAHLNLTANAMLPRLRDGVERARSLRHDPPARYRRDIVGWLIWRSQKTPGKFKTRTAAPFVPTAGDPPADVLAEFDRLHAAQIECVQDADGLPIHKVTIASPFSARVRYSVYSAFTILPTHEHRHLWQAERAADAGTSSHPSP